MDNWFKHTTLLWQHHGSVAYPGGDLSCSRTTRLALQSQQKVFKATYPPFNWHCGRRKWLKGHVSDIWLSLEVGYSRFPLLLHEGTGSVCGSVLRAAQRWRFPCCQLSAAVAQPHPTWGRWQMCGKLSRSCTVSQFELELLVKESLPAAR